MIQLLFLQETQILNMEHRSYDNIVAPVISLNCTNTPYAWALLWADRAIANIHKIRINLNLNLLTICSNVCISRFRYECTVHDVLCVPEHFQDKVKFWLSYYKLWKKLLKQLRMIEKNMCTPWAFTFIKMMRNSLSFVERQMHCTHKLGYGTTHSCGMNVRGQSGELG